jgi:hypothetical protein|tara:strand:+ start:552 stop:848 length:297 start_codon:yes stop_codon:yes gene_type:complete
MIRFFVFLLVFIWGYKLAKILLNSKDLTRFAKEFDKLSKKHKFSDAKKSECYKIEAKNYRSVNKKTTISSLIWFFIEVGFIVLIYLVFVQKHFSFDLF